MPRRRCSAGWRFRGGRSAVHGAALGERGVRYGRTDERDSGSRWTRNPREASKRNAFVGVLWPRRVRAPPGRGCTRPPPGVSPGAGSRCASVAGRRASGGGGAGLAGLRARMRCRRTRRSLAGGGASPAARFPGNRRWRRASAGRRSQAFVPASSYVPFPEVQEAEGPAIAAARGYRRPGLLSGSRSSARASTPCWRSVCCEINGFGSKLRGWGVAGEPSEGRSGGRAGGPAPADGRASRESGDPRSPGPGGDAIRCEAPPGARGAPAPGLR